VTRPAAILVVDDEEAMRDACAQTLRRAGHMVREAATAAAALEAAASTTFDVMVLDLRLQGQSGMDVLDRVRADSPSTAVIVITGYATVGLAVEAMRRGATDFLDKPFTPDRLRTAVCRALELHPSAGAPIRPECRERGELEGLVGESPAIRQVRALLERVGPTDSTVLITGESGTGKEVVARILRDLSPRRAKPFVVVDCGALVGTLFESELFGHVRGSFTGATTTKHGRLELADGGTIFFDEIGNVGPEVQAKLLRVIQEREYIRVGGNQVVPVDLRIIAATSASLVEEIKAGRFREDLYYRLCVVPVTLPPLRQRMEDLPLLLDHFLAKYGAPGRRLTVTADAMDLLRNHSWPGNVRELQNTIERAVILAERDTIRPKELMWLAAVSGAPAPAAADPRSLEDVERAYIERVLEECGGNRSAAARILGIDRKTLWRKLRG
jgi:DNA-binding NtrC family response regulator